MPFKFADDRYVDEEPVPGPEMPARLSAYDQLGNFGREEHARYNVGLSRASHPLVNHADFPQDEDRARHEEPHPKVWAMQNEEKPEHAIEDMGPVEYLEKKTEFRENQSHAYIFRQSIPLYTNLKMSFASDNRQSSDANYQAYSQQSHPGWHCPAWDQAKNSKLVREQDLGKGEIIRVLGYSHVVHGRKLRRIREIVT